jgi:succinoglycan biosynthesis protein ExoA
MRIDIVLPVRDAAIVLPDGLAAIATQTRAPGRVHIAVGPSRDDTARIVADAARLDPRIVVHQNPAGDRASGINLALAALDPSTEAVAMVDAQARLAPDYLERAADVLEATGAAVVGGAMHAVGRGVIGRGIAAALASPVGVGDSSFHFVGEARDVDAVYLGVYRRSVLDEVGPYDPSLLRTEDDDVNARIRAGGGRIRLDPSIRSDYLGRQTLGGLFRQYRGYGFWKVALAAKRPDAIRPRHLVPALFVAALVGATVVSVVSWPPALPIGVIAYLAVLAVAGLRTTSIPFASRLAFVAAAATMHLGYGIGSWQAILTGRWRR